MRSLPSSLPLSGTWASRNCKEGLTYKVEYTDCKISSMRPIPTVSGCGDSRPYMWINEVEVEDAKTHEAIMKKDHIAFTAES